MRIIFVLVPFLLVLNSCQEEEKKVKQITPVDYPVELNAKLKLINNVIKFDDATDLPFTKETFKKFDDKVLELSVNVVTQKEILNEIKVLITKIETTIANNSETIGILARLNVFKTMLFKIEAETFGDQAIDSVQLTEQNLEKLINFFVTFKKSIIRYQNKLKLEATI